MIRPSMLAFALSAVTHSVLAVTYTLPPEGSCLIGAPIMVTVPEGNTLPLEAFAAQTG